MSSNAPLVDPHHETRIDPHHETRIDPHRETQTLQTGAPLDSAERVMIMIHGRGASASDILQLSREFGRSEIAYLAPQAAGNTWYPYRFLVPTEQNEPYLSSALARVGSLIEAVVERGFTHEQVMLLGFSQGACLVAEYAARYARRYGAIFVLSGGLIGPTVDRNRYTGQLAGTPVFLGCADADPHIPVERVHETAQVLQELGGDVAKQIYEGSDHSVNRDEIERIMQILDRVGERS